MRDDFKKSVKENLAHRVGFRCSNPQCRKPTSGPSDEATHKHINIGVAAHIYAAAVGGPRYDAVMSPDERSAIDNGIWLCQSCAKLIDSDTARYTKELLFGWKSTAEEKARDRLSKHVVGEGSLLNSSVAGDFVSIITHTHPLQPSDFFRGRDAKLDEVKRLLVGDAKMMLLNGMGGIGKTEFCRKLFHECINDRLPEVNKVGWLVFHESIEQTFFQQFTEISFQTDSPSDYLVQAKRYLDNEKGDLLLFVDNANDLSENDVALLLQLRCKVVLTSRRRSVERLQAIEIGKLDMDDCRILYRQHSEEYPYNPDYNYGVTYAEDSSPDEDLDAIITMADRHTLAIELLAKTQKSAAYSTRVMREILNKSGFSLSDIPESITYVHTPEVGDWEKAEQIFIEQFSKVLDISNIKNEKLRVLQLFSLLSTDTLSAKYIRNWFEVDDLDIVNALVSQGWVFRNNISAQQDTVFSMHPLITSVVRHKALPSFETAAPLAIGLSEELNYDGAGLFTSKLPYLNHAISLVEAISGDYDEYPTLISCIVVMLNHLAEYGRAMELLEKAKSVCESDKDIDPLVTSTVYNNIAFTYNHLNDYKRAKEWYKKAIEIRETHPGTDESQMANSYDGLGDVCSELGEKEEAIRLMEKALKIRKAAFGDKHPHTAVSYINLGTVYSSLGDYKLALKYHKMALSIQKTALDKNHPDLATTYNNLGQAYDNLGKPDIAMKYFNKALAAGETVYGLDHPDVLLTRDNIASLYMETGEYKTAIEQFSELLEIRKRTLGERHHDTAINYNNLGTVYYYLSDFQKALELFDKAVEIITDLLGERHHETAALLKAVADAYSDIEGMEEQAIELYKKVLDIQIEVWGEYHPHVAITYNSMGIFYMENEEYMQAMQCFENSLRIHEKVVGRKHAYTSSTLYNMGMLYEETGEFQKALELFFEAYEIIKSIHGADSPDVAAIGDGIARSFCNLGDYNNSDMWFNKSIQLYKKYFGDTNLQLSITYHYYADMLEKQSRFVDALIAVEDAYEIELRFYPPDHKTIKATENRINILKGNK